MKSISIFQGKSKRLKAVWSDGYITTILWTGEYYKIEGNKRLFKTLQELTTFFKGEIKTLKEIKNEHF